MFLLGSNPPEWKCGWFVPADTVSEVLVLLRDT